MSHSKGPSQCSDVQLWYAVHVVQRHALVQRLLLNSFARGADCQRNHLVIAVAVCNLCNRIVGICGFG